MIQPKLTAAHDAARAAYIALGVAYVAQRKAAQDDLKRVTETIPDQKVFTCAPAK